MLNVHNVMMCSFCSCMKVMLFIFCLKVTFVKHQGSGTGNGSVPKGETEECAKGLFTEVWGE